MSAENQDDILDTLTPEERAAMSEEDPQEKEALARIAAGAPDGDADGDDDDDDGDDGDEAAGAPAGAPTAAAAPSPAPAPAPAAGAPEAAPAPTPAEAEPRAKPAAYRAELPQDFADKKADVDRRATELRERFKSGEIELDEYEVQRDQIEDERDTLRRLELKAEISQEMNQQTAEQQWFAAIDRQIEAAAKPENGGINYLSDSEKMADLDAFVKTLASRQENRDKPMDWFLAEAHKRVLSLHGITPQKSAATPAPAAAADAVKAAVEKRKPPVESAPPSLAHVPGADGPGDMGGDEFADLDKLEGVELEAAISRLSPAQREKYLAGV